MAWLVYDGSSRDHSDTPAVAVIGKDGKPVKRRYAKPPKREFHKIEVRDLWGVRFHEGEAVFVDESQHPGLAAKAKALGCFEIFAEEPHKVELVEKDETPSEAPAEAGHVAEHHAPKRRGRPRKEAVE